MLLLRMLFYFRHFSSVRWGADVIIKDVTLFLSFLFSQMRSWCYYYGCYFIFVISLQSDEELMLLLRMLLCFRHFSSVRWGAICCYYGCYFIFVISLQSDEELMLLLRMLLYFCHFSSVRGGADVIIMDVTLFLSFLFSQMRSWCYYYRCYFIFVISLQSDEELMLLLRMLLYFRHFSSVRWGADVIIIDVTLFFRHFSSVRWGADVIIIDVTLFSSFLFSQMRSWCYY